MYGVEIFTGEPNRPYQVLGEVWAQQNDGNIEDCNAALVEQATRLGADGIININYERKISWTSWSQLNARGTAVRLESLDIPCPVCAEMIKRAAKKCRFCNSDLG